MRNFDITNYKNLTINAVRQVTSKDLLRAKIQRDIKAFQALDGAIEPIPQGISSYVHKNQKQLRDSGRKK